MPKESHPCEDSGKIHQTVYVDALAQKIADVFDKALSWKFRQEQRLSPKTEGLESPLCNDVCLSGNWQVGKSWKLEESNPHQYPGKLLQPANFSKTWRFPKPMTRNVVVMDSNSGDGLKCQFVRTGQREIAVLWSSSQCQACRGLYPAYHFGPTRLQCCWLSHSWHALASLSCLFCGCLGILPWGFGFCRPWVSESSFRQLGASVHFVVLCAYFMEDSEGILEVYATSVQALSFCSCGWIWGSGFWLVPWFSQVKALVTRQVDFSFCGLSSVLCPMLAFLFWILDFGLSTSKRALSVGFASAHDCGLKLSSWTLSLGLSLAPSLDLDSSLWLSSPEPSPLQALQGETFSFSCACAV